MQIDGITSIPRVSSILSAQPAGGPVVDSSRPGSGSTTSAQGSTAKPAGTQAAQASSASSSPSFSKTGSNTHAGSRSGGSAPATGAAASAAASLIAAVYTFTVDGKTYTGSVEQSDGEYVASIPGLSGAVATGANASAAETNLGSIIDELA